MNIIRRFKITELIGRCFSNFDFWFLQIFCFSFGHFWQNMAKQLKSDLASLQQVFTKTHDQFRILSASVDEVVCRFMLQNKTSYDIQANIPVSLTTFFFVYWYGFHIFLSNKKLRRVRTHHRLHFGLLIVMTRRSLVYWRRRYRR